MEDISFLRQKKKLCTVTELLWMDVLAKISDLRKKEDKTKMLMTHHLAKIQKKLLDVDKPDEFVTEFEYSIYKAQQGDFLNNSGYKHYTIVRPAITYSKKRFQLTRLLENRVNPQHFPILHAFFFYILTLPF